MNTYLGEGKTTRPFGVSIQHQSIGLIETDFHHPEALAFDRFDPSLGTLHSVLISCESRAILLGSVKNHSTASERFTVTVSVEVSVATPPGLPPAALQTVPSITAMFSLAPGRSVEMPWNAGIDQKYTILSAPGDLALFTGPGRWHLRVSTATSHAVMGGGGCIESNVRAKAAFDITVQYEFFPVRNGGRKDEAFSPILAANPQQKNVASGRSG
jgi:hypothetical protein